MFYLLIRSMLIIILIIAHRKLARARKQRLKQIFTMWLHNVAGYIDDYTSRKYGRAVLSWRVLKYSLSLSRVVTVNIVIHLGGNNLDTQGDSPGASDVRWFGGSPHVPWDNGELLWHQTVEDLHVPPWQAHAHNPPLCIQSLCPWAVP
jgi:hypothetical protein